MTLIEIHEIADEKLENIHHQLSELIGNAKKNCGKSFKEIERLYRGWKLSKKISYYGTGILFGILTRNSFLIISTITGAGIYQWIENDSSNLEAEQHIMVTKSYLQAYKVLNNTRNIVQYDINILYSTGKMLENLIHYIEDIGFILAECDYLELTEITIITTCKFNDLFMEYQIVLNSPFNFNKFKIGKNKKKIL